VSLFVSPRASSQEDDKAPKQAQSSGSKAAASTDGSGLSCQSQSASLKLGEICSTHAALPQYLDVLRGSISHLHLYGNVPLIGRSPCSCVFLAPLKLDPSQSSGYLACAPFGHQIGGQSFHVVRYIVDAPSDSSSKVPISVCIYLVILHVASFNLWEMLWSTIPLVRIRSLAIGVTFHVLSVQGQTQSDIY
jgi:hypothetical protein